jgi:hypothetical protein
MFNNVLKSEKDVLQGERRAEPDEQTESMEAGYGALFQPEGEEGMNKFFQIKEEITRAGVSATSRGIKYDLHEQETKQIELGMTAIMEDFEMDADVKANFIGSMGDIHQRPETTLPVKLSQRLIVNEDEAINSDEYEQQRLRFTNSIDSVMGYREAQQAVLEQKDFEGNQSGMTMAVDLAQMIIPFVEEANVAEALIKVGEGKMSLMSFFLMGNSKQEFFDSFKKMPLDQRLEATEKFIQVAKEANKTGFITNQLLEQQMTEELLYGGRYSTADKWIDNLVSLFDLSFIGKPAAWAIKFLQKTGKTGKAIKAGTDVAIYTGKDIVRSTVSPISPVRVATDTNAGQAKLMFHASMGDETEDAARAFSGTTKTELAGDTIYPDMGNADGVVRAKIHRIYSEVDKSFIDDVEIQHDITFSNVGSATPTEMETAAASVQTRLREAVGVTTRDEMFQHTVTPTGARITGVYGPDVGGWGSVDDAVQLTELALREQGITANDMHLLSKDAVTGEYIRVDSVDEAAGDFLIGIDYDYRMNFSDIYTWDELDVNKNWLDRIPLLAKYSVNRAFFEPGSMFQPHLVINANASVDKGAKITQDFLKLGKKYTDPFGKQSKDSQALMTRYVLEANDLQIPHNINTLKGEYGFNDIEIAILKDFRAYWDTIWQVSNITDVRAMRNKGMMTYENVRNQDRLYMKPLDVRAANANERVYNPLTDETLFMSRKEIDDLYDKGGVIGRMRRPQAFGDEVTDQIRLESHKDLRMMLESDTPYPYREGYFQRTYTQPHFIIQRGETSGGVVYERAVATANTRIEADLWVDRLRATDVDGARLKDGTQKYYNRGDLKDPKAQAEYEMDTYESTGMSSMRSRGEKLVDATAQLRGIQDNNVLGPVDSMIRASRAMGRNVAERETIEAMKQRFMSQYKETLATKYGKPIYPKSMEDIGNAGNASSKEVADARSTYEFISYLEFGYINGMDSIYKGALKGMANNFANVGKRFPQGSNPYNLARTLEEGTELMSHIAPVSLLKNASFQAYIASFPIRQAALNVHQAVLLSAAFPKYTISQGLARDLGIMYMAKFGVKAPKVALKLAGRTQAELDLMFKQWERSGLSAQIDQNNMVRGAMMDMAEGTKNKQESGLISGGLHYLRKIGFDAGEEVQLMSSWLAHYNDSLQKGKVMNETELHNISGRARNFTFNMNRAGDMVYNANSLGLFFQYFQVPHKSALQLVNRSIPGWQRLRVGMYDLFMFTLPPAAMLKWFSPALPSQEEHPEAYDAILMGLEFYLLNKMISLTTGEQVRLDFGNFAPSDAYGMYDMMYGMWTTESGEMFANAPSGQLFFGNNPRITNAVKTVVSYFWPDPADEQDPVLASQVYHDIMSLSSGYSSYYKAKQKWMYGKAFGLRNQVTDQKVNKVEAAFQLGGIRTMDETMHMAVKMEMWESSDEYTKDVNKWYRTFTHGLVTQGLTLEDEAYLIKVMAKAFSAFDGSEKAMLIVKKNLDRDLKSGTPALFDSVLRQIGWKDIDEIKSEVDALPDDEYESKENARKTLDYIKNFSNKEDK